MTDYFDRLELELRAATVRAAPERRPALRHLGTVMTALAVAAAAAVAVIAIAALHQRHPTATNRTASSSPYYHECFPTKRVSCLLDDYGVLRRPPAGARPAVPRQVVPSMWFGGEAAHQTHIRLLAQFNRAVRIGPGEAILFVVHSTLGPPNFYLGAFLEFPGGGPVFLREYWPFQPAIVGPDHKMVRWVLSWSSSRWVGGYEVTFVPDPVARVKWVFPARRGTQAQTVYANVHDNVAVAHVARGANTAAVTEYGANGRVLATRDQLPIGLYPLKPSGGALPSPLPQGQPLTSAPKRR